MRATQPTHRRRFAAGLIVTSVMALSILGSGTALAANPNWFAGHGADGSAQPTGQSSTSVAAGKHVGFAVWMKNADTSNISQLFLTAKVTSVTTATFFGGFFNIFDAAGGFVRGGTCPTGDPMDCPIGALRSGETVDAVTSFTVSPTAADLSTLSLTFEFNTTGTPPGKNNSHGDAKQVFDSVKISSNRDADGDFNLNDALNGLNIADNQSVSPQNPQATSASVAGAIKVAIGGSVGEIAGTASFCDAGILVNPQPWFSCGSLTSQISTVEIANGQTLSNPNGAGTPGIQVKILFKKAPSQLSGSQPFVYHRWTDSSGVDRAELVFSPCGALVGGFPTTTGPCLIVGNNAVTVWLTHNGGTRM
jgi:hypothetical protein